MNVLLKNTFCVKIKKARSHGLFKFILNLF